MQQLQAKLKNTPTDVKLFLVRSSVSSVLNKEEIPSVQDKVLTCNNPEGIHSQHRGSSDLRVQNVVYVLNKRGQPLMPTTQKRANALLKEKKAKVVKRVPFTIQLNQATGESKQEISLGIDSGYQNIGFSCVTSKRELVSGTVVLDSKTSDRLTERRMYRRGRRNKLWYREPRWQNRTKKEGWLPPSVERRYLTHLNLIDRMKKIMPVSNIIVETANFDIQKIENPTISGKEYQQGNMFEYQNLRSFLMAREKGKCQLCGKEFSKRQPSHVHHCKQRSESGSNRPENLAILHKKCHEKLHNKNLKLKPSKEYKPNTFMSIVHKRFSKDIPNLQVTYDYETFVKRIKLNLEKSHSTDAFVIANGSSQTRIHPYEISQKHRHSRVTQTNRNGYLPSIKSHIYKIQPKDLVWHCGKTFRVLGVQNKGEYVKVENCKKVIIKVKSLEKVYNFGGFSWN